MNEPERIYLTEDDGMDAFAPEPSSEPHRPVREASRESLDVFQSEVFASQARTTVTPRASAPVRTRHGIHPASLVAVAGIAAVFAVVLVQQSNAPESVPNAPTASSTTGTDAPAALPPITSPPPAASPSVPESSSEPSSQAAAIPPPPVSAQPEGTARSEPPLTPEPPVRAPVRSDSPVRSQPTPATSTPATAAPRMPRPLSQDPGRLAAGVTATTPAPSPRGDADVPAARPPAGAASAPPPVAEATPPPSPPPPAVTPPTAAAPTTSASVAPPAAAPPAAAPPPAAAAAPPAAASAVIDTNTAGIQNTLTRYRQAFSTLSASAARQVWPTVNEGALSRAFDRLEEQQLSFDGCQIQVNNNERAEAVCSGTARYVPRVGSRTPRTERRQWHFNLVKVRDEWMIGAVDAR